MNTAFYIAKRYLFSKKSTNAINIISGISMLGVFVGSAALIIILSVFNGFESLILSLYDHVAPDITIEPAKGKTFDPQIKPLAELRKSKDIEIFTDVLLEKALLRYGDQQFIGRIKGVSKDYLKNKDLDSILINGDFILEDKGESYAIVGSIVQYTLGINIHDLLRQLEIYSPRKGDNSGITPADEFSVKYISPIGVVETRQQSDDMVIVPIKVARDLLDEPTNVSLIEISLKNDSKTDNFKDDLERQLGKDFLVKNKIEQNASLYKILNSEKWAVYLILTFILIIAIFNIIGSLTMLVIDKRKDIAILTSLGASKALIRQIFFLEGMMIAIFGCALGLIAGTIFCVLQKNFQMISMGVDSSLINAYPVEMQIGDVFLIFTTVLIISFIASSISSRLSVERYEKLKEDL